MNLFNLSDGKIKVCYIIRNMEMHDIEAVVKIHLSTFSEEHFSAYFSHGLLKKYFQSLNYDNKFHYVIYKKDNDNLIGYLIAGTNFDRMLKEFIRTNFFKISIVLLKNPKFIKEKLISYLSNFFSTKKSEAIFRVFIFATDINFQRVGIGKLLIKKLEDDLKKNNINIYGLSVRNNNINAINFYRKNSFVEEFTFYNSIYFIKFI